MAGRAWRRFIERRQTSIEDLPGTSIADAGQFRRRLRLNRALARASATAETLEHVELQRVVGNDDLLPFYVLELGAALGKAVCKLGFDDEQDGTGFLIAPDILVTNNHVIPTPERAREARCIFDYQLNVNRKPQETVTYRLDPEALFITSAAQGGLDYTFVRIDPAAGARYPPIPASRGSFTTLEHEFAHIVQHPGGKMKRVALRENRIIGDSGVTIHYLADAEGGSSGSPVFNNDWQLIGLHHAARVRQTAGGPGGSQVEYFNEAIKMSAIAAHLEQRIDGAEGAAARQVLRAFSGTDSLLGYFGVLGRPNGEGSALKKVMATYAGEAHDVDIGFWNLEWLNDGHEKKISEVAKIITDLQLDIYVLMETTAEAVAQVAGYLAKGYGMKFDWAASRPDAPADGQGPILLWNVSTVARLEGDWPDRIKPWFEVDCDDFGDLGSEALAGKVFDFYPGLFRFRALNREKLGGDFDFNLVPLHLKALTEGAFRRRMGTRILGAAVAEAIKQGGDADWVIGGDFNAQQATEDLAALAKTMLALSAEDEGAGAMTYLRSPKSPIEHIFISPNLIRRYGARDFFTAAANVETPEQAKRVTDHRPVLLRLGLSPRPLGQAGESELPDGLAAALHSLAA